MRAKPKPRSHTLPWPPTTIMLSKTASAQVERLLATPQPPTAALIRAYKRYKARYGNAS